MAKRGDFHTEAIVLTIVDELRCIFLIPRLYYKHLNVFLNPQVQLGNFRFNVTCLALQEILGVLNVVLQSFKVLFVSCKLHSLG